MPSSSPIKIAIVEDHPEFRDALVGAISASPELRLLGVCRDLPNGLQLLDGECPDVLLVDLGLPSGSGLSIIRAATRQWPGQCCAAVLTVTGNEDHLLEAVKVGAKGYLFKSDQPAAWISGIFSLAGGQSPVHPTLAGRILQLAPFSGPRGSAADGLKTTLLRYLAAGYLMEEAAQRMDLLVSDAGAMLRGVYDQLFQPGPDLSEREHQLLILLERGFTFKQCAELMGVSESTTKTQGKRAYQKLGASNLQTAIYEARACRLIP